MSNTAMDHLSQLESRSIYILREAYSAFPRLGMLWSMGKDSSVLLALARKAFFGEVPFPVLHVDTSFKLPEMIEFRTAVTRKLGLDLIVAMNETAIKAGETFPDGKLDRISCCAQLKTKPLRDLVAGQGTRYRFNRASDTYELLTEHPGFDAIIAGVRADEEGTRSKERYFSPRNKDHTWAVDSQPPEFWDHFNTDFEPGLHVRVHPLLDWTELNIWQYIQRENLELVPAYFADANGCRYRSLGCANCTNPIQSQARTVEQIIQELESGQLVKIPERQGRAQDAEDGGGLESLRRGGYM